MILNKIREIRRFRRISIKELSKITGVNRDRISLIERGKVNPSFETVVKIVIALNAEIKILI